MAKLLICYSSHEGQTRKILEHIVRQAGDDQIEWRLFSEQQQHPITEYDRVLLGASIRYGHFPKVMEQWIAKHATELEQVGAAFIGVCLTARKPEKREPETNLYMRKWLKRSPWKPQTCAVFAGALRYSRYNWWQTRIIQLIMWMTGGSTDKRRDLEFTDWKQVEHFAKGFFNNPSQQ